VNRSKRVGFWSYPSKHAESVDTSVADSLRRDEQFGQPRSKRDDVRLAVLVEIRDDHLVAAAQSGPDFMNRESGRAAAGLRGDDRRRR